ncbi:MAG: extracellular solute-binding protein [Ruminococcaceae bacterium]|nr:extracellular solute-binding protein [Oscillospiraceae bacterium]
MKKILSLLLAGAMTVSLTAACASEQTGGEAEKMTLKVWGPSEDQDPATGKWLQTTCEKFNQLNPQWDITFEYGVCGENDAGKKVTADVTAAADVYMYASDQLGMLMDAQALSQLGGQNLQAVKDNNSEAMINAVTYTDGGVYGVPFSPNTWFLYYNKNTYTEEDVKSLETMLQKGKVAMNVTDGWYLASFYVAGGGTLFGNKGTDSGAGIQFGGDAGTAVTDYLVDLMAHPNFINDKDNNVGLGLMTTGGCDAFFSGTWKAADVKAALGENYAAAALPAITINGEQKQLRSFAGAKAIGVNPNCKNQKAATALAVFLGSQEAQLAHYELRGVAPCHPNLVANEKIAADIAVAAQAATVATTAVAQPSLPAMNDFWAPAVNFGNELVNGTVTHANAREKTEAFVKAINGGQ